MPFERTLELSVSDHMPSAAPPVARPFGEHAAAAAAGVQKSCAVHAIVRTVARWHALSHRSDELLGAHA